MHIEVWADIVCPWCYLGKRRFDTALASFDGRDEVEVVYRSFELDPAMPDDADEPVVEHLASKYGVSLAEAQGMSERVTDLAAAEGLSYRIELTRTTRTFDAHRLIHCAADHDVQAEVTDGLFAAYFTRGARLNDPDALLDVVTDAGLPPDEGRDVLSSDRYADAVRHDEQEAQRMGIRGVPFFAVERRLGVSGAQTTDVFSQFLHEGRRRVRDQ